MQEQFNLLAGLPNFCHWGWVEEILIQEIFKLITYCIHGLECIRKKEFSYDVKVEDWQIFYYTI
jgi:hypothetical protein